MSKTMKASPEKTIELRALILELIQFYESSLDAYPFPWEAARWYELVFCLAGQVGVSEIPTEAAHRMVSTLADLNLLEINTLAAFDIEDGKPDLKNPDLALMLEVLTRFGLSPEKANALIVTICEVAAGFQTHYQGNVQRFLRKYGRTMVKDLGGDLNLSQLTADERETALTNWLQNVINMPLVLSESKFEILCEGFETNPTDLVQIVDDLGLNLTVADDLLFSWIESEVGVAESEESV